MANYQQLKNALVDVIKQNGSNEITGEIMQTTLLSMINSLGTNYQFAGILTPSTSFVAPDENVYLIGGGGKYNNFGANQIVVPNGSIGMFMYNGTYSSHVIQSNGVLDVSALNAVNGVPTQYSTLQNALNAIPSNLRYNGMEIIYIDSTTEQYVNYRMIAKEWSVLSTAWQGVDNVPNNGSINLVTSGGAAAAIADVDEKIEGEDTDIQVPYNSIAGYLLNADGTTKSGYPAWAITDYISVSSGDELKFVATKFVETPYIAIQLYNTDKEVVSNITTQTSYTTEIDVTVQSDGYLRVCYLATNGDLAITKRIKVGGIINSILQLEEEFDKLQGKITIDKNINFVGMSIWWYDGKILDPHGFMGGVLARGYQTLLKEQFHFLSDTGTQYCYSGNSLGALTQGDTSCIMNHSSNWQPSVNAIWTLDTITNDFKRNIPIGTIDDYLNDTGILTYYGALRKFKDKVVALSGADAIVVCANSLRRDNDGYTSTSENANGDTLTDFEYALMNVAARNNWHFIDQFRLSGITDDSIRLTTLDGLHLNNFGYTIAVKPWIEQFNIIAGYLK